jgi:DNA repair protein RecO (recombination protein O)
MEVSDQAIALHRVRYGDTSLILTWLSREHGKIRTMARGVFRPKSALAGRVDLFHLTRITWSPSRRGDLHHLREAEVEAPFTPGPGPRESLLTASFFVSWVDWTTQDSDPHPEIFSLLQRGLQYLGHNRPTKHAVRHFEKELVTELGLAGAGNGQTPDRILADYAGRRPAQRRELWPLLPER